MPTNLLRARNDARTLQTDARVRTEGQRVAITAGTVTIRAELLPTETAVRIWRALPLFSTAERWGDCIHFETPIETGRERTARLLVTAADICFWCEEDRVIIAFGRTPISGKGELRLHRPSNIWARALDDTAAFATVTPGEKVTLKAI